MAPEGHRPRPRRLEPPPLWTGGGTVFGPQPRHYTFKVNRKERRAALRSALSLHAGRDSLGGPGPRRTSDPSAKQAAGLLADWGQPRGVLVILTDDEAQAALSFRNLDAGDRYAGRGRAHIVGAASFPPPPPRVTRTPPRDDRLDGGLVAWTRPR